MQRTLSIERISPTNKYSPKSFWNYQLETSGWLAITSIRYIHMETSIMAKTFWLIFGLETLLTAHIALDF
jgi:hypothetical protein